MRLHVGFDFDDVIVPWYEGAHRLCLQAGITNGVTPVTWAPHEEYGCEHAEWVAVLEQGILDGVPYDEPPFHGVLEAMNRVKDAGHYIHIITARGFFQHGELIRAWTHRQIAQHEIPHDTLTFSKDKGVVYTDAFLDDRLRNLEDLRGVPGTRAVLLNRPWNQGQATQIPRVDTVGEYVDLVLRRQP